MKKLILIALAALPLTGCVWPNINNTLPTNGSYCISNLVISTPWGTEKVDWIYSQERQLTNQFDNGFLLKRK